LGKINHKSYGKLIDEIFSQGDSRYFNNYSESVMIDFLEKSAIEIERIDVSKFKKKPTKNEEDAISGPQKELKFLTKSIFEEYGIYLEGFEKRYPFGVVDVMGKKDGKTIFVECGPCRIDKGFNYMRTEDAELWVLTSELDLNSVGMQKVKLYTIKRGPNWQSTIKNYDEFRMHQLKKVKSPLDSL